MADLTTEQKTLIVSRLACYASPSEIAAEIKDRFNIKVTASQIAYYDPLGAQGSRELHADWKSLFWHVRGDYDRTVIESFPVANKAYRLMLYQRIASDPVLGKSKIGLKALEQAAKETGGLYERPELSGDIDNRIAELLAVLEGKG